MPDDGIGAATTELRSKWLSKVVVQRRYYWQRAKTLGGDSSWRATEKDILKRPTAAA
jgi:hypothetical protein